MLCVVLIYSDGQLASASCRRRSLHLAAVGFESGRDTTWEVIHIFTIVASFPCLSTSHFGNVGVQWKSQVVKVAVDINLRTIVMFVRGHVYLSCFWLLGYHAAAYLRIT